MLGTFILESNSATVIGSSQELIGAATRGESIWTLKVHALKGYESVTYADTGIENELLRTGVVFPSSFMPVGVYVVVLPVSVPNEENTVMSYIADVLQKYDNFATVVVSSSSTDGSKTAGTENL